MLSFHSVNPQICHGHLTPHNIFLGIKKNQSLMSDDSKQTKIQMKIGDLESTPLLKRANLFHSYRCCSVWSPPEILKLQKKFLEPRWQMDIYSFGMVMWEIWHEHVPFDGDTDMAIKYVLEENSRPMVHTGSQIQSDKQEDNSLMCTQEIGTLIRQCWQADPENRPTFLQICESLDKIIDDN